jgi:uncharacterized integral membrane protein (TIGR00697 family)
MYQSTLNQHPAAREKGFKLFSIFAGVFVTALLLANITAQKLLAIGPFTFTGGIVVFPISYIFGDILTEVYGYELTRKIIWTGLACQVLAAVVLLIVGALPPAPFWKYQEAYNQVLGVVPRIMSASIVAYLCGEFCNSVVLSKMKYRDNGQRGIKQTWRFVASTIMGEGVDTVLFIAIAFTGIYSTSTLVHTAANLYVLKVAYEVMATPVSTRFANWVKRVEGVDHIDRPDTTTYNPFSIRQGPH